MLSFLLMLGLAFGDPGPALLAVLPLRPTRWVAVRHLPEPSDVCVAPDGRSLYIVSDDGVLFQTDLEGRVLRRSADTGFDFEAVATDTTGQVLVMDEGVRRLHQFEPTGLRRTVTHEVPWGGGRNKGMEGLCWNPVRHQYLTASERDPARLVALDARWQKVGEWPWTVTSDVSALTYYAGAVWLLADEARELVKLDARTYDVLARWRLPVLNPEGLAFLPDGQLVVLSDDLARLYFFPAP